MLFLVIVFYIKTIRENKERKYESTPITYFFFKDLANNVLLFFLE